MKTTFITFRTIFITIVILLGTQTVFGQSNSQVEEDQVIKYTSKPILNNTANLFDTVEVSILNRGGAAQNYETPYSQIECFHFGTYPYCVPLINIGIYDLNFRIYEESSGVEVYQDSISNTFFGGCDGNHIVILPHCFLPPSTLESFTGIYHFSTTQVEESDYMNNYDTIDFVISENTFSKEKGGTQTIVPDNIHWETENEPHSWAYGNFFYIVNGNDYSTSAATFGLGNADDPNIAGRIISIFLYKWDQDKDEDGNMDPDERTYVGFNIYKILGTEEPTDLITVPLLNFPSGDPGPVDLESNQAYVLMVEYATDDEVNLAMVASTDFNYYAPTEISEYLGTPRYPALLAVNGDLSSVPYKSAGFGQNIVPVVRLTIVDIIDNTSNSLGQENKFDLSPNPADNLLIVEIEMEEAQNEAFIKIFDVNGRLLTHQNYKNIKYEKIRFDLTKFAAGTYFLQFVTDAGVRTKRFVVHHF